MEIGKKCPIHHLRARKKTVTSEQPIWVGWSFSHFFRQFACSVNISWYRMVLMFSPPITFLCLSAAEHNWKENHVGSNPNLFLPLPVKTNLATNWAGHKLRAEPLILMAQHFFKPVSLWMQLFNRVWIHLRYFVECLVEISKCYVWE